MKRLGSAMMVGVVAALVAGTATSASAQYVQIGAGVSIPMGDFGEGLGTGLAGQLAVGFGKAVVGGRLSTSYIRNSITDTDHSFRIIGAMADLVVAPRSSGKVAPYFIGGVGLQNGKSNQDGAGGGDTKFAWNAGAGLRIQAGGVGLFLEGRFLSIKMEGQTANMIPITAGVRLGGR